MARQPLAASRRYIEPVKIGLTFAALLVLPTGGKFKLGLQRQVVV
jgi:hypothetical protein